MAQSIDTLATARNRAALEELQIVLASEKAHTLRTLANIFGVAAVMELAIPGEEPESDSAREVAEWKLDQMPTQLETKSEYTPTKDAIGFASDIQFIDTTGIVRHKESRNGMLSQGKRTAIASALAESINQPDTEETRAYQRELFDRLAADNAARSARNEQGQTVLEHFQAQYQQPFTVAWQGAYLIQQPDGSKKAVELTILGDYQQGIPADYVAAHFNPAINAGIPLVEAAREFAGSFFIQDPESGRHVPISLGHAYQLVVNKVLPQELLDQALQQQGEAITPLIESEAFADYWLVTLAPEVIEDVMARVSLQLQGESRVNHQPIYARV